MEEKPQINQGQLIGDTPPGLYTGYNTRSSEPILTRGTVIKTVVPDKESVTGETWMQGIVYIGEDGRFTTGIEELDEAMRNHKADLA